MPECYVRGSTIKYLRIPDEVIDMVKEDIQMKSRGRGEMKGRGQNQRGRGGGRGNYKIKNYTKYVFSKPWIFFIHAQLVITNL